MLSFKSVNELSIESLLTELDFEIFEFEVEYVIWIRSHIEGFQFIVLVLDFVVVLLFFLAVFAVEYSFFVPFFLDFLYLVDEFLHVLCFLDVAHVIVVVLVTDVRRV